MPSNDDYCVLIDLLVILIFFYEKFLLPLKNFLELPLIFEEFKKTEAADFFASLSFWIFSMLLISLKLSPSEVTWYANDLIPVYLAVFPAIMNSYSVLIDESVELLIFSIPMSKE